jgi:hypothetical protein
LIKSLRIIVYAGIIKLHAESNHAIATDNHDIVKGIKVHAASTMLHAEGIKVIAATSKLYAAGIMSHVSCVWAQTGRMKVRLTAISV